MSIAVKGPIPPGWQVVAVPDGWTEMLDRMMFHACQVADATEVARMTEFRSRLVAAPVVHEAND